MTATATWGAMCHRDLVLVDERRDGRCRRCTTVIGGERARSMTTADRCAVIARDIRATVDPAWGGRDAAIAVLVDGLVQLARQGHAAQLVEHLLAVAGRELGVEA